MLNATDDEILTRMRLDNPWWTNAQIPEPFKTYTTRDYFSAFRKLVLLRNPHRAVVLMGPRRIGKTVMILHMIAALIQQGNNPHQILYVSIDAPNYNGLALEKLLAIYENGLGIEAGQPLHVFFDEIQYLRDWEIHLKALVDSRREIKFVASGSAAAALKLKSNESGAGRFTDFILPPLTFAEFLRLTKREAELIRERSNEFEATNLDRLNEAFGEYLNFGGYPELATSDVVRENARRFIGTDIIEKVLLRDLPGLYGVSDTRELNSLFTVIARNTGMELSLEQLSQGSGVSKNTLKRYLEYLEAAFLVRRIRRIDQNARQFQRDVKFKIYLTTPALRAALFGALLPDDESFGRVAETAVLSQWLHSPLFDDRIRYARWPSGEVDIVYMDRGLQKPDWAVEIKWSNLHAQKLEEIRGLIEFGRLHPTASLTATSRSVAIPLRTPAGTIQLTPTSLYCYKVGKNVVRNLDKLQL